MVLLKTARHRPEQSDGFVWSEDDLSNICELLGLALGLGHRTQQNRTATDHYTAIR